MRNGEISTAVALFTADNSKFETSRNYISLSHIALNTDEIIRQYKQGFDDSLDVRLKCYKGYQMEGDLLSRLKTVFGDRIKTGIEISVYGGLVKGHPDFSFDGFPADCKSVLMDDWFPKDGKLSRKIYWQMQAYMRYSGKNKALVIYESRESGKLMDYWINANYTVGLEIDEKIIKILNQIA